MFKIIFLLLISVSFSSLAINKKTDVLTQQHYKAPEVYLKSTFYGDNRERIPVDQPYAPSYTFLGMVNQLYLKAGQEPLRFHLGVSHRSHFGGAIDEEKSNLLAWFHASIRQVSLKLGMMPFDFIGDISPALFEEIHFRYPVLDGMLLQYKNKRIKLNLWLDWVGRQTEFRREAFLLGLSVKSYLFSGFEASFDATLYHHAGLRNGPDVLEESGGMIAKLAYEKNTSSFDVPTKYLLSAGYYLPFARDRKSSTDWDTSQKFIGQFQVTTKYIGLDSEISVGDKTGIVVDFRRPAYQSQKYIRVSPVLLIPQVNLKFHWDFEVIDNKLTQMQRILLKYQKQIF